VTNALAPAGLLGGGAAGASARTIGSLCTGYGGLDMAVQAALGGTLSWVADPDPGAAALLAHHHPDVPNLGDITVTDWARVPAVDIVCAGFPCQDISYAGRGEGIREGNRSGLWHVIADALAVLRPGVVVLENVAAIVGRRPGFDVVLADLATLGFDAEWTCVRASDVGAPHRRERWFLVAAHATDLRHERDRSAWTRRSGPPDRRVHAPADAEGDGRDEPARQQGRPDAAIRSDPAPADAAGKGREARREGLPGTGAVAEWGQYGPAIEQWARILGRPVPRPTEPAPKGGQRLSPRFVEWLMGVPDGWITNVPGLTRNQMLKLGGNGVVPQQGAAALAVLLDLFEELMSA
jgi:DNA (cytosine-5)-methyltransferase 1